MGRIAFGMTRWALGDGDEGDAADDGVLSKYREDIWFMKIWEW